MGEEEETFLAAVYYIGFDKFWIIVIISVASSQ